MPIFVQSLTTLNCWLEGGYLEKHTSKWIACGPETSNRWVILIWAVAILWVLGTLLTIREGIQSGKLSQRNVKLWISQQKFKNRGEGLGAILSLLLVWWGWRGFALDELLIGCGCLVLTLLITVYIMGLFYLRQSLDVPCRTIDGIKAVETDEYGTPMYLVSFVGYGPREDEWMSAESISPDKLRIFHGPTARIRDRYRRRSRSRQVRNSRRGQPDDVFCPAW